MYKHVTVQQEMGHGYVEFLDAYVEKDGFRWHTNAQTMRHSVANTRLSAFVAIHIRGERHMRRGNVELALVRPVDEAFRSLHFLRPKSNISHHLDEARVPVSKLA